MNKNHYFVFQHSRTRVLLVDALREKFRKVVQNCTMGDGVRESNRGRIRPQQIIIIGRCGEKAAVERTVFVMNRRTNLSGAEIFTRVNMNIGIYASTCLISIPISF